MDAMYRDPGPRLTLWVNSPTKPPVDLWIWSAVAFVLVGLSLGLVTRSTEGLAIALPLAAMVALLIGLLRTTGWFRSMASREGMAHELDLNSFSREHQPIGALAEGLEIAVFICDAKGIIEYANGTAMSFFNAPESEGRSILAVTLSYDIERLVLATAESGAAQSAILTLSYPEDAVSLVHGWCNPEQPSQVFVSIQDISDLRRLERVRQDFVANVSHELRTPMATIRAMAEVLQETEDDPELRARYLTRIIGEIDRLTHISNDLLVLSAAESKNAEVETVDFSTLLAGVAQQLEAKAKSKGLRFQTEIETGLTLSANPTQLTQVAMNLVDNAINYTAEGTVSVSLHRDGDDIVLRVADTGVGISSEHIPRIFERFYRVDKARSRDSGGTGLGLSIVKHIVESHGGRVSVESEPNKGSAFTVTLPSH